MARSTAWGCARGRYTIAVPGAALAALGAIADPLSVELTAGSTASGLELWIRRVAPPAP